MSNQTEAKRKLKDLIREVLAEEKQKQEEVPVEEGQEQKQEDQRKRHQISQLRLLADKLKEIDSETTSRYLYTYADRPSKDIFVQVNEDLLNQAKEEATKRKLSLSSYVRECLLHRLYKITPEKELEINNLLKKCKNIEEGHETLVIEGEEGFLNQIAKRNLTDRVWTFNQIDKVARRLCRSPRSTQEQCFEAMKLDKMQTQYFTTQLDYFKSRPPEETTRFEPFAICDRCHRPLTKEQYNLPKCPYCDGTQGTEFVYDKKAPVQSKPYAMCSDCYRPLPEEAKTWNTCKYCGTNASEIVLNYEGIQRQPLSSESDESRES